MPPEMISRIKRGKGTRKYAPAGTFRDFPFQVYFTICPSFKMRTLPSDSKIGRPMLIAFGKNTGSF